MAIVLSCECGRKLQIGEEFAGQEGQCPSCGRTMIIPASETSEVGSGLRRDGPVSGPYAPAPPDKDSMPDQAPARDAQQKLTNHGGGSIPRDSDFFVDPPADIGPILSAHSTLLANKRPWTAGARLIAAGLSGLVGLAIGAGIVLLARPQAEFWHFLWPTVGAGLGVALGLARTRFFHTCTYVGRDGVAKFACAGSRERVTAGEIFLFRDASELRTGQSVRYVNGRYQGTDYFFTWTDVGGRKRYAITGTHTSAKDMPPTTDPYHFGRAAEMAWTVSLLAQTQRQIELAGSVPFNLRGGHSVRVSPEGLTIQLGGEPMEWPAHEIEAVIVDKGVVKIKRTGAKEGWFSTEGVAKFPFDSLANARLFFHLLDKVLHVRIG